ncbi:MAG: hypothetical protein K0Q77_2574 [Anaerosporomusa subterranea]|jgi:hypothetical protein|nr:hypothetical protein [Anaerosporomusa subterranea]
MIDRQPKFTPEWQKPGFRGLYLLATTPASKSNGLKAGVVLPETCMSGICMFID